MRKLILSVQVFILGVIVLALAQTPQTSRPGSSPSAASSPDPNMPRPIESVDSVFTEEMTWLEIRDAMRAGKKTVIVATGGVEMNGPYLTTGKHNYIMRANAEAIARKLGNALVAPIVPFVPEGTFDPPTGHLRYPGTVSVTEDTYKRLLTDIVISMKIHGFEHIVLIGDSAGNQAGMKAVAEDLSAKWAGGNTKILYIAEYYDYPGVTKWLESQGIRQIDEGHHDDFGISAQVMVVDLSAVRMKQRMDKNLFSINGIALAPPEKSISMGKRIIDHRATITVEAIKKAMAAEKQTPITDSSSQQNLSQSEVVNMRQISEINPEFKVDPFWPKPFPNNWLIGQVSGVAIDSKDHIWIIHRPASMTSDEAAAAQKPPLASCCIPAPPAIELDQEGNVIQAWGGRGAGYEWPETEHGIFIDYKDNIWIGGSGPNDHQVLKFSRDGKFLLQIGQAGKTGGSNDTKLLGRPADFDVDPKANEVYIADGYLNRRIIVFDADTGAYKRHWGAYSNRPDDSPMPPYDPNAPPAKQFRNPVHGVRIAREGLVYIADRVNCRIQVFERSGNFIKEAFIAKNTLGPGSCWDIDFSADPEQKYLFVADGSNQKVWVLDRTSLSILGEFGRSGRYAGQFHWVHNLASDSKSNIYAGEVDTGKRVQKFIRIR